MGLFRTKADAYPEAAITADIERGLIARVVEGASIENAHGVNILLFGPPGTGKTELAKLAAAAAGVTLYAASEEQVAGREISRSERLTDLAVFQHLLAGNVGTAILLLGMYIGQSEKNIAEAFESAREAQAMLIFDEADSFLFDRRQAVRSWEVSQVNEMLTWMEHHPLPFCCITNMMERFDSASLRRFTFHILFHYLDAKALARAYAIFFQMAEVPPHGLAFLNLTPGDFAQARRQADILGIVENADRVIALIAEIRRTKPGNPRSSIGFVGQPS